MVDVKLQCVHHDGPKMDAKPQHLLKKQNCFQDKIKICQQQYQALSHDQYFCVEELTKIDLQEKRKWFSDVSTGRKYQFVDGKWRGSGGTMAHFYHQS